MYAMPIMPAYSAIVSALGMINSTIIVYQSRVICCNVGLPAITDQYLGTTVSLLTLD